MDNKIIFVLLFWSFNLNAEIIKENNYFNTLCIADDSNGFDWKNGRWNPTRFYTSKYIVQKLKIEKPQYGKNAKQVKSGNCYYDKQNKNKATWYGNLKFDYGCYNIRETGSEFYPHTSELCSEIWKKDSNGKQYLDSINCKYFKFRPNGEFHQVSIDYSNLEQHPKNDYKDSLSISVGKCSTL